MDAAADKENVAPFTSSDPLQRAQGHGSPQKPSNKKGRSKSIGPGSLDLDEPAPIKKENAKDRRKSAFVPATKSILSKNEESERAARRKSMMNRRVSFAPEATLHTWDIIVDAKDHTTSTDSTDSTRRASGFRDSSSSLGPSSDASQEDEDAELLSPPSKRRSSGIPPMNFNNPDDAYSSGVSGSEESGSEEDEDEAEDEEDDMGTAMSLDVDDATMQSTADSDNGTASSDRLEAALRAAASTAGTRGIEYDEFGDMSMEIAGDEVTNAMKPWAQRQPGDAPGSASLDQENVNPFSPAFKAEVANLPATLDEEDEDDMSMDVTHAVGGILKARKVEPASSPMSDCTMELTQAVGKITGQKRRRSTAESGYPEAVVPQMKRSRRSSVARSSMGDDTMDLTAVVGGIQSTGSPVKPGRRRSLRTKCSSGAASELEDATMEFTRAVGGIRSTNNVEDETLDGNEELSMEITTALGGIKNQPPTDLHDTSRPVTPRAAPSPTHPPSATTPKGQERFKNTPDLAAKKLLTPILKEPEHSAQAQNTPGQATLSVSPLRSDRRDTRSTRSTRSTGAGTTQQDKSADVDQRRPVSDAKVFYPDLTLLEKNASPVRTPIPSPQQQRHHDTSSTHSHSRSSSQQEHSFTAAREQRVAPHSATPEKTGSNEDSRDVTNSLKLLTTPRKEALKIATPRKPPSTTHASPVKATTPKGRPTPKSRDSERVTPSPIKRLREDVEQAEKDGRPAEKIGLQDFLTKAGIRFMDLTHTKRRLTTVPTPSRERGASQQEEVVNLEDAVISAACVVPELELYQHACHEIKRHTKEGKQMISDIENTTLQEQPLLIRAYIHAAPERRAVLDTEMRDLKTDARLQSKKQWYEWRSKILNELMTHLQNIGEGMIKDDEILGASEAILNQMLPQLATHHSQLQREAETLEESVNAIPEDDKETLASARGKLVDIKSDIAERRNQLARLWEKVNEQDSTAEHLRESKEEFTSAILEANRVRDACRGVSLKEVTALQESVKHLEDTFGWSIVSASSSPSTITMVYKSEVQLFFHPQAFQQAVGREERSNAPIRLSYVADGKKSPTTTLRFFLQLLQASLQGLPQYAIKISDLLGLVSDGWNSAVRIAESERKLSLETLTNTSIVSDEQLAIAANVLLPDVKTKIRATFELTACVNQNLRVSCKVEPRVVVVYGELYKEQNMTEFLRKVLDKDSGAWDAAVAAMKDKLVKRGEVGDRK